MPTTFTAAVDHHPATSRLDSHYLQAALRGMAATGAAHLSDTAAGVGIYPDRLEYSGQVIPFSFISNNSGERMYIFCPICNRRYRHLYYRFKRWACRKCNRLAYPRKKLKKTHSASERMMKSLKKLGVCDLPPTKAHRIRPDRPKGMHRTTYEKLLSDLLRSQEEYRYNMVLSAFKINQNIP